MKAVYVFRCLLVMFLAAPPLALAHESFEAYVRHDALITARPSNLDIQIDLTFYRTPSLEERRGMDGNGDGRITSAEVKDYLAEIAASVRERIALRVDGRSVALVPMYEPEVDLLGQDSPTPHPHVMRILLFARTPDWLAEGSVIALEDGLWAEKPSIRSFFGVGEDGIEIATNVEGNSLRVVAADRGAVRGRRVREGVAGTEPDNVGPIGTGSSATPARALTQRKAEHSTAVEFVGKLVQDHPYLFDPEQRAVLDEINRQLREAASRQQRDKRPEARREIAAVFDTAITRLLDLLEQVPSVVRVSVENGEARRLVSGTIRLPGDVGALLLRIEAGPGEARFVTTDLDMAETGQFNRPIRAEIGSAGTTWGLVSLENVPVNRSSLLLEFRPSDRDTVRLPIDVVGPARGRLKVTVLSADSGKPVPAMVRLVWKTDGHDRKPSNAIELAPQFDSLGKPSGRRRALLPGPLRGFYWCVPGPFDMTVPPGHWEITIRRGLEHIPVFDSVTIKEGKVTEKSYRPRRWVDMREHGWYSGDDHVHARILSDKDAENLMAWARAEDIHVANILKMGDIHRTYFQQRGFGKDHRVVRDDYVLVPGQEDPRTHGELGHTISLNIEQMVRHADNYLLYDLVFDQVHAQGGLVGYAHILGRRDVRGSGAHRDMSINVPKNKVDFVELLQFGRLGTSPYYEFLNIGFKLTASAGSDPPWGGTIGEARMYAYVGDQPFSADAWFEAVRRGRTFITHGPMIDFRAQGALPGDEIRVDGNRKLRVRARAWGHPDRVLPSKLEIIQHGEVVRTVEATKADQEELQLDFEVEVDYGFWIAARAEGSDGTRAHTTPVYVIREPFRFWKLEAAEELIAKRLASLDEVEHMVVRAQNLHDDGRTEGSRTLEQLALQGPDLLERVAAARKIYEDLSKKILLTIEITGPSDGTYVDLGKPVAVKCKATARGSATIQRVEFAANGSTIGVDTEAPYELNWKAAKKARYSVTATAYDNQDRIWSSKPVTVYVGMRALERFVTRSTDNAEELADGSMYTGCSALELINAGQWGDQVVGLRFTGIRIPRGAQIKKAYLQFMVDGLSTEPTDLTIHAELVDNANAFEVVDRNITSRQKTTASVKWSPEPWNVIGERSEKQRTPNLSSLIQEVVAQPDWQEGNALVFIISGSGKRVATSYDGDQQNAPMLYVEY